MRHGTLRRLARSVENDLLATVLLATAVAFALLLVSLDAAKGAPPEARPIDQVEADRGGLYAPDGDGRFRPLPLLATEIRASISGLVARTTVRHRFRNTDSGWVEAIYVFPLPDGSAVDQMRMVIGERVVEGRIAEREQAKRTFAKAKREGRRAGLVEQERPNMFTSSIANIGPGEDILIEIGFQETLDYDAGGFQWRIPLVVGPRYIPGSQTVAGFGGAGWGINTDAVPDAERVTPAVRTGQDGPGNPVALAVELDAGVPLASVTSASHAVTVTETGETSRIVTLTNPDVPADRDFVLEWRPSADAAPTAGLFRETVNGEDHLLLMLMPPAPDAAGPAAPPRDVIFVIDTSGSMHGASLDQAKKALHLALDRLRPIDRFNIVSFANVTNSLFYSAKPALPEAVTHAHRAVDRMAAEGGTEMLPALRLALLDDRADAAGVRQVVLITDGAIGNEAQVFGLIATTLGRSRLFTVGIGSAPNSHFMAGAARKGRGEAVFISDRDTVGERMAALFAKLEQPALTDLRVIWPDGTAAETWPNPIPDLYAGEPLLIAAKLPDGLPTGGNATVIGDRADGTWRSVVPLNGGRQHAGIGRLWARMKITGLTDSVADGADRAEVRTAVIDTALAHGLISRFTSLVAADTTPARPVDAPLTTGPVPTNMPDGWSREKVLGPTGAVPVRAVPVRLGPDLRHVNARLPQTATPALLHLLTGLVALLLAGSVAVTVIRPRRIES